MSHLFKIVAVLCLTLILMSGWMSAQPTRIAAENSEQATAISAATGQVDGNLPNAIGVKVILCDSENVAFAGTPAECNGKFEQSVTVDSTGRFVLPSIPPGTYFILFDIPDPTKVKDGLCRDGEYYRQDATSDGAIEFCLDGKTLGPTISVEAGKATGYPAQTDAAFENAAATSDVVPPSDQSALSQTFVASDHSFSFSYPANWGTPDETTIDVAGGITFTKVKFANDLEVTLMFFPAKAAVMAQVFLNPINYKKTQLKVGGRDLTRLEGSPSGSLEIEYGLTLDNGATAIIIAGTVQPDSTRQADSTLQAVITSVQAPASSKPSSPAPLEPVAQVLPTRTPQPVGADFTGKAVTSQFEGTTYTATVSRGGLVMSDAGIPAFDGAITGTLSAHNKPYAEWNSMAFGAATNVRILKWDKAAGDFLVDGTVETINGEQAFLAPGAVIENAVDTKEAVVLTPPQGNPYTLAFGDTVQIDSSGKVQPYQNSSAATPNEPQTPSPTETLAAALGAAPKPGTWQGEINGVKAAFKITRSSQFDVFVIAVPDTMPGTNNMCYLGVENTSGIKIDASGGFIANKPVPEESLYANLSSADIDFIKKTAPTPVATDTSSGQLVDVYYVTGKFTSSTTAEGTYSVMDCKGLSAGQGYMRMTPATGKWKADWMSDTP